MQLSRFAVLTLLILAQPAVAGDFAPKLASHVVNLTASGGSPCPDGGIEFDVRIDAAGTLSRFYIPDGQVLVLDFMSWSISGSIPGVKKVALRVGPINIWVSPAGDQDTTAIGKSEALPNIAVRGGSQLCYWGDGDQVIGPRLHGFLMKDS